MRLLMLPAFLSLLLLSSCLYHMPGPDDFSDVPFTNNPTVYRDLGPPPLPGVPV